MPRRNAVGITTRRVISSGTCKLKLSQIWCPSASLQRDRAFPGSINLDQWNRRFKDAHFEASNPVPSLQIAGAPAFNIEFDFVCRSLVKRLRRYTTQEACGCWNRDLLDDFRVDSRFITSAEQVNVAAPRRCDQNVVSDGLSIVNAEIEFAVPLSVDFRFQSLDGPRGYSSAPSRFSIHVIDSERSDVASFRCGLREPAGAFWYPHPSDQFPLVFAKNRTGWAFFNAKKYGGVSLAEWIANRASGRG